MALDRDAVSYIPIGMETLRLDTAKSFDIFLRVAKDKYVLYLSRENAFTEVDLAKLVEKRISGLYVSSEDAGGYRQYVEEHLSEIVRDPAIPVEKKSRIVYETSSSVVEDVFKEPRAETIQRSNEVISSAVNFILSDDEAAKKLMQLTSRDYYTYTHSVNVCVFSVALAKRMFPDMADDEFQRLGAALTLYDVGKSRIPLSILNKRGPLDDTEWDLMRTHSEQSASILKETGHLTEEARIIALQHHERLDGTGYPKKLRGEEIHEFAQICAIADAFDALTTNRAYGEAMSTFDALNMMKGEMNDHFAKEFFDAFVLLFAKHI